MSNSPQSTDSRDEVLVRLIHRGNQNLHHGRYNVAEQLFEQAMGMIDLLMAAHGSWLSADRATDGPAAAPPPQLSETLISLAHLSDQILKCLARTRLAAQFGQALRERHVPEDLAALATGRREVGRLLAAEENRLLHLVRRYPKHAEMHYRLGLLARVRGRRTLACREFERVLTLAPDHSESAVRLAATLLEQGQGSTAAEVLQKIPRVDLKDLWQYSQWEIAAADDAKFDRVLSDLEQAFADTTPTRLNLPVTLGEARLPHHRFPE